MEESQRYGCAGDSSRGAQAQGILVSVRIVDNPN